MPMMDEFLKLEYEQCLSLVQYYDEKHLSLMKFAGGLGSAVAGVFFGFHELLGEQAPPNWPLAALLSGFAFLGLLAIYMAMVQNRVYFVDLAPSDRSNSNVSAFGLKH
jgi:hypothetical protein